MGKSLKSIDNTKYDVLCYSCQKDLNLDVPQFHGMVAFKGDFESEYCGRCEDIIV